MVVKSDLSLVVSDGQFSILVQKFKVLSEIGHKFTNSGEPKTRTFVKKVGTKKCPSFWRTTVISSHVDHGIKVMMPTDNENKGQ